MACIYYLVFFLSLLPLSTLTTAEQYGGAATLDDQALIDRFCLRGRRPKLQTAPSKSLDKTSDAAMQETTVEAEKLPEDEEGGKVAMHNSKESTRFQDKAVEDDGKMKKEYKLAAASPFKPKGSNYYDSEDVN